MKKNTLMIAVILANTLMANAQVLERWTHDEVTDFTLWANIPSEITGSSFGTASTYFVAALNNQLAFSSNEGYGLMDEGYFGGISAPSYTGSTNGNFQISYDITDSDFTSTGSGAGRFGWGIRSTATGTIDCNLIFEYNNGNFNLIVTDGIGTKSPVTIATGTQLQNIRIRQLYDLNNKIMYIFYAIGIAAEIELYPGQLTLPSDFRVDELRAEAQATSGGYTWLSGDITLVDNIIFESPSLEPNLEFVQETVSYIEDYGVLPNPSYEPGDVLKIITENINDSIISVSDVTSTLSAPGFNITPISPNTFSSLAPQETYFVTNRVEVLDGAVHGSNTFTVVNQIGTGTEAMAFPASFP